MDNMPCRGKWEDDLTALVPVSSSGEGPEAEQSVLKLHVSPLTWAVSFGSVTEIAVHDLVNLSCDYLLHTNKPRNRQKKKKHGVSGCSPDL